MIDEGLTVKTGVHVGVDLSVEQLKQENDAIVLTGGFEKPRDLPIQMLLKPNKHIPYFRDTT